MPMLDFTGSKKLDLHPIKVTQLIEIAPNVFLLSFNRSFSFVPGQVVALAMNPADQYRYYSIASGMLEAEVKILFEELKKCL